MVIRGRVRNGVVVLEDDVCLPDGTEVSVVIRSFVDANAVEMTEEQQRRYREALDQVDSLPNENSGDSFCGADHDRALYGEGS